VRPLTPAGDGPVWLRLPARPDAVAVVRQALAGLGDGLGTDEATMVDI
jgi:hypothetical protein